MPLYVTALITSPTNLFGQATTSTPSRTLNSTELLNYFSSTEAANLPTDLDFARDIPELHVDFEHNPNAALERASAFANGRERCDPCDDKLHRSDKIAIDARPSRIRRRERTTRTFSRSITRPIPWRSSRASLSSPARPRASLPAITRAFSRDFSKSSRFSSRRRSTISRCRRKLRALR